MRRFILVSLIAIALPGCVGTGNIHQSRFKPYIGNDKINHFDFETDSSVLYKENDAKSEQLRLSMLDEWISNSSYCPNGYVVTYRKSINLGGPDGYARIFYSGKCKI